MTWNPTPDIDEEIRWWMKAKGWEVTATDYHFDQEIYSWRHQVSGGKSPTLRIARRFWSNIRLPRCYYLTSSRWLRRSARAFTRFPELIQQISSGPRVR